MEDSEDLGNEHVYHHAAVTEAVRVLEESSPEELDDVLGFVENVYNEVSETLSPGPELIQRLSQLHIKRRGGMEETADTGSSRTTVEQLRQCYGEHFKTSRMERSELKIIRKNWQLFTKRYGLSNPMLFLELKKGSPCKYIGKKNMYRFKMFLAYGLQGRSLFRVYRAWKMMFCTNMKHKFTPGEIALLQLLDDFCVDSGQSRLDRLNLLSTALQRGAKALQCKLRELEMIKKPDKITWTLPMEESLVRVIVNVTGAESLEQLREMRGERIWTPVKETLGVPKTDRQLYNHWHLHLVPALFPTVWRRTSDIQLDCIRRLERQLRRGEVSDWRNVDWASLARKVGDYGSYYVYSQVMRLRRNLKMSKETKENMTACIGRMYAHLLDKYKVLGERLPRPPPSVTSGKCLRRAEFDFATGELWDLPFP